MRRSAEIFAEDPPWLRRLARRMTRSAAAADDLVQDTCLTALDKPEPDGSAELWVRGILRKLAWGEVRGDLRRARREERFHLEGASHAEPDPLLGYGIDRERLHRSVDSLPEPFRSTVLQRFVEGLSCAEIARAEGVPAGTVRWRQSRALELLRAELANPPRPAPRHRAWLVLVGLESSVALGRRIIAAPSRAKLLALALVAVALALGLSALDDGERAARPDASGAAAAATRSGSAAGLASGLAALAARLGDDGGRATILVAGEGAEEESRGGRRRAGRGDAQLSPSSSALEALRDEMERALYDCSVERGVLRCVRQALRADQVGGATCLILDRSLGAIGRARRRPPWVTSAHGDAFLAAARLANQSLASALGCAIELGPEPDRGGSGPVGGSGPSAGGDGPSAGGDGPSADGDGPSAGGRGDRADPSGPSCTTDERPDGRTCTTCIEGGSATTTCAPVDCRMTTLPDGSSCTTCTDADGRSHVDCDEVEPVACDSEVGEAGQVCSSCPAGSGAPAECLVAECLLIDHCRECTDGRGRVARDCTRDYELSGGTLVGWGGQDHLRSSATWWDDTGFAGSVTHYAGTDDCVFAPDGCLRCTFADGSGMGACPYDKDLDKDLARDRPVDLPEPGQCVTERRDRGKVECSTCTRGDLSASTICRFPPSVRCRRGGPECAECSLVGGGTASSCTP